MKVLDGIRRFAPPAIPALIAAALQIGGYQDTRIANILWITTGVLVFLTLITWEPIRSLIRSLTKPVTSRIPVRVSFGKQAAGSVIQQPETNHPFTIHLGVRWEDSGDYLTGGMVVAGPFCPTHLTPLRKKTERGSDPLGQDTFIQDYPGRHAVCLEDGELFGFGRLGKGVDDARGEAKAILVGMRRRGQRERREPNSTGSD